MNELKKIAYNCRKATYLIEKKQTATISLREKIELKIHLAGCSVCRLFERQSIIINRMVKELINPGNVQDRKLDDEFKNELQGRIEDELNKH